MCALDEWRGVDCRLAEKPAVGAAMHDVCTTLVPKFLNVANFDPVLTKRFRVEQPQANSDRACCFSSCHPFDKPATRPRPRGRARRYGVHESCLPAPEAGSKQPAAGDPQCPATVIRFYDRQPFSHSKPAEAGVFPGFKQCCYAAESIEKIRPSR